MKNLRILSAGILVLALAAAPLAAQMTPKHKPMMHQEMMCRDQLNLTPEQQEQIQNMKLQFQKEMLSLQTELKTKMLDLRALMTENADTAKINAQIEEAADARASIQKKAYSHHMEIRNILTEEQKKIFDKMCHSCGMPAVGGPMDHHGFGKSCMGHSRTHGMKNPFSAPKKK